MRKEEYFKRNRGKNLKGKNILNIIKGRRIFDFMEILLNFKLNEIKVKIYYIMINSNVILHISNCYALIFICAILQP